MVLPEPAQEQPGPRPSLLLFEPHLQPVSLVLPADQDALAQGTLQLREQAGEVLFRQGGLFRP